MSRDPAQPPMLVSSLDIMIEALGVTEIRILEIKSTRRGARATLALIHSGSIPASICTVGRSVRTLKKILLQYKECHGQVSDSAKG